MELISKKRYTNVNLSDEEIQILNNFGLIPKYNKFIIPVNRAYLNNLEVFKSENGKFYIYNLDNRSEFHSLLLVVEIKLSELIDLIFKDKDFNSEIESCVNRNFNWNYIHKNGNLKYIEYIDFYLSIEEKLSRKIFSHSSFGFLKLDLYHNVSPWSTTTQETSTHCGFYSKINLFKEERQLIEDEIDHLEENLSLFGFKLIVHEFTNNFTIFVAYKETIGIEKPKHNVIFDKK